MKREHGDVLADNKIVFWLCTRVVDVHPSTITPTIPVRNGDGADDDSFKRAPNHRPSFKLTKRQRTQD
jgi:hypothetical protein